MGHVTPGRENIAIPLGTPRSRSSIIQLNSNHSAAGKTSLCHLLTTLAVLPQSFNGRGSCTVWLDTDGRFSAARLDVVMSNFLSTAFPKLSSGERVAICFEAFRHVHLFRPQSTSQLVTTLESLPSYLLHVNGSNIHFSASRSVGLIVLDSAVSFYWQERFETDVARFEAMGTNEHPGTSAPERLSRTVEVITALKKLQKLFDCTIVFTSMPHEKLSTMTTPAATGAAIRNARLPPQEPPRTSPWTAFATLNLSISHDQVRQFATVMSFEECRRDQGNRLAALAKGRSIVSVDWIGSHNWANGVRDAVNRVDGQGLFAFRVNFSGILVEE